mgnify:CR=1 FL=1
MAAWSALAAGVQAAVCKSKGELLKVVANTCQSKIKYMCNVSPQEKKEDTVISLSRGTRRMSDSRAVGIVVAMVAAIAFWIVGH